MGTTGGTYSARIFRPVMGIINIVDDMLVCFNKTVPDLHYLFYLHDHSKQELYQILYQRNRTRSNSPKSP